MKIKNTPSKKREIEISDLGTITFTTLSIILVVHELGVLIEAI